MSPAESLATYLSELETDGLPPSTFESLRVHVLDSLVAVAAGRDAEISRHLAPLAGPGPEWQAFAAAARAHSHEVDDIFDDALLCIGGLVVPSALAVARARGASGAQTAAAIVAGYEAMGRLGLALGSRGLLARGWWPTAICGAFGVAAATGRLVGLTAEQMTHALALAAQQSGGLGGGEGGSLGRLLAYGACARNGMLATELARSGVHGPLHLLDHGSPLSAAYSVDFDANRLAEGLGEAFVVDRTAIKPYACARQLQAAAEAALALYVGGARADTTERVIVDLPETSRGFDRPVPSFPPSSRVGSAQWVVATCLARGRALPGDCDSSDAFPLAQRVEVRIGPVDPSHPFSGAVTVETAAGSARRDVLEPRGGPSRPLSFDDVVAKARDLVPESAGRVVEKLVAFARALERMREVTDEAMPTPSARGGGER